MDMTETNLPKTTEMLHTLSVEQLKELKGQITQMIALKGGNRFSIGAKCGVNHRRLFGRIGIIKKIN
jgi:hypothetical protein